ncbi:MAG: hypothetical protein OXU20_02320 [Myxococcales bacterium]|nr:hypothetical protein [Myxococcales bacterium]MDD9968003.1 hypothetical protein [Myxococcales bacterium]
MIGTTGRRPYPSIDSADLSYHREQAVLALRSRARQDDEEAQRLRRQLEEIDKAIERGVALMPIEERRRFLMELYEVEREQPDV